MVPIQLPNFAERAPMLKTVASVAQIRTRDRFETMLVVELRCKFVGDAFEMDETIVARGCDRLLISMHGVRHSPFDACDLRRNEGMAIPKILWAVIRPTLMFCQLLFQRPGELLLSLGACLWVQYRQRQCKI